MQVRDKAVLITGASEEIGKAMARRFAQAGAKLALVARSTEALDNLANRENEPEEQHMYGLSPAEAHPAKRRPRRAAII